MRQFQSIEKLDTGILYALELSSSISVLLLAFGLIASMANVLTKGSVLTDNLFMQRVWAWTQCIAIDASVAGTIIRTFRYHAEGERVKTWLYGFLSALLLFTAAIVSNIESVQQTLNIALDQAYAHVFIPVEALIWIRSVAIVLLIVAHAMRHVHTLEPGGVPSPNLGQPTVPNIELSPEVMENLRVLQALPTVVEEEPGQQALPVLDHVERETHASTSQNEPEQSASNYERVRAHLERHPNSTVRDVSVALKISVSTANKWMNRVRRE